MNILQLDKLIETLNPTEDKELISFYLKKRKELTRLIAESVVKKMKRLGL